MSKPLVNKGFSALSQLSVFLGIWGACFIGAVIATIAISLVGGLSLTETGALMKPENRTLLIITQVATTFFVFGLPAVWFAFVCFKNGWDALGLKNGWQWKLAGIAIVLMVVTSPLTDALGELNRAIPLPDSWRASADRMEKAYEEQVKSMLNIRTVKGLVFSLILVAALPALFEELFFRGGMQGLFLRWWKKPWVAITISAFIFSAIHFSWYGFVPRMMLGIILGVVYYATGNLWYSILMHFLNNAVAVSYLFYEFSKGKEVDTSQTSIFPIWAGIISAAVIFILAKFLLKLNPPQPVKEVHLNRNNPFENQSPQGFSNPLEKF